MLKVLSLFSGIGAFEKALDNLEVPYNLVGYCEIDKYASKSYAAIHGVDESMNFGDITKIDQAVLPKGIDLITYGFPCQDISLAGKQKGLFNEDGTQSRSGLFFEALRIIEHTQPKVAIAENVKNLISKKFNVQFQIVLQSLEEAGYNNYWKVLNSKDYGVPQNRDRVFIISIRKDIDTGMFEFPKSFELKQRLKDILDDDVDEKYFIKQNPKMIWNISDDCAAETKQIAQLYGTNVEPNPSGGRVYDSTGIMRTLGAGHGMSQPIVGIRTQDGLIIRKLTPKECFRLMGFDDKAFYKAEVVNSNAQLYKQAGNSIVVDVLEELFCMMLDEYGHLYV